jgi:hypothetical protein
MDHVPEKLELETGAEPVLSQLAADDTPFVGRSADAT